MPGTVKAGSAEPAGGETVDGDVVTALVDDNWYSSAVVDHVACE